MSASDLVTLRAQASAHDALTGLKQALASLFDAMLAARCGPHHFVAMRWSAPDPAALHPSRHVVDLAWREVFGGFRPPLALTARVGDAVEIEIDCRPPGAPSDAAVYRGYTLPALAGQYSPRNQADMREVFRQWTADGGTFRAGHQGLDLAYGPGPYHTLDLYRPTNASGPLPLWFFLHGGYWQASDKDQHAQFARGMLDAGFAVAMPNYRLAPDAPLAAIVEDVRAALAFTLAQADALGIDATNVHVAGHSAGGHLAAMLALESGTPIRSALLLSGLFDLEPLAYLPVGKLLGLHARGAVGALSPIRRKPIAGVRIGVAVGAGESDEFKRQSTELAAAWGAPPPLVLAGAHHFSLLDGLNGGPLLDLATSLVAPAR